MTLNANASSCVSVDQKFALFYTYGINFYNDPDCTDYFMYVPGYQMSCAAGAWPVGSKVWFQPQRYKVSTFLATDCSGTAVIHDDVPLNFCIPLSSGDFSFRIVNATVSADVVVYEAFSGDVCSGAPLDLNQLTLNNCTAPGAPGEAFRVELSSVPPVAFPQDGSGALDVFYYTDTRCTSAASKHFPMVTEGQCIDDDLATDGIRSHRIMGQLMYSATLEVFFSFNCTDSATAVLQVNSNFDRCHTVGSKSIIFRRSLVQ